MQAEVKNPQNPWKSRELLPAVNRLNVIAALLVLFLCGFGIACYASEAVAFCVSAALFLYVVYAVRRTRTVILVLLSAVLVALLSFQMAGGTVFLSLAVGTATLAWLINVLSRNAWIALLALLLAFGAAFAVTQNAPLALLAFTFLPAGILLSVAIYTQQKRTTAICFAAFGFLLTLFALLAFLLYRATGSLAIEDLRAYIVDGVQRLANELARLFAETAENAYQSAIAANQAAETAAALRDRVLEIFSAGNLRAMLQLFLSLSPAFLTVLSCIVAYEAHLMLLHFHHANGWQKVLTREMTAFVMSTPAAVLYAITFLLSLILGTASVFGATVNNVAIILLPGFCLHGFAAIGSILRAKKMGITIALILILVAAVACIGFTSLYFIALLGANSVLLGTVRESMRQKLIARMGKDPFGEMGGTHAPQKDSKEEEENAHRQSPREPEKNEEKKEPTSARHTEEKEEPEMPPERTPPREEEREARLRAMEEAKRIAEDVKQAVDRDFEEAKKQLAQARRELEDTEASAEPTEKKEILTEKDKKDSQSSEAAHAEERQGESEDDTER